MDERERSRRRLLLSGLFGVGWAGLRALATGLPIALFSGRARAATCAPGAAQRLILITSAEGDPLNANVPGCYDDAGVYHPPAASMAPTKMLLGAGSYTAAKPWAELDAELRQRTCFFHHGTYTNAHGDAAKVNRLMGAVKRQEMMISMFSQNLAACLGSVQAQPVVLSPNLITSAGAVLPAVDPVALRTVLGAPTGPLASLRDRRDADLDRLNALYKQGGRKADAAILDRYAQSQAQARALDQTLLNDLAAIQGQPGTRRTDLNIAAAVMMKLNVSPVVVMSYRFGGDNHVDAGLATEARETVDSVAAINDLYARLKAYGLADQVTIALQNVFGRTLALAGHGGTLDGRHHNPGHHVSVFIGKGVRPTVIGGITLNASATDYRARGIVSSTGVADDGGDVPYEQTLASAGKTLGRALGVDPLVVDDQITTGKVVSAALM